MSSESRSQTESERGTNDRADRDVRSSDNGATRERDEARVTYTDEHSPRERSTMAVFDALTAATGPPSVSPVAGLNPTKHMDSALSFRVLQVGVRKSAWLLWRATQPAVSLDLYLRTFHNTNDARYS